MPKVILYQLECNTHEVIQEQILIRMYLKANLALAIFLIKDKNKLFYQPYQNIQGNNNLFAKVENELAYQKTGFFSFVFSCDACYTVCSMSFDTQNFHTQGHRPRSQAKVIGQKLLSVLPPSVALHLQVLALLSF